MEVFHKCYGNVLWAKKLAPLYLLTEVLPMEDEYYICWNRTCWNLLEFLKRTERNSLSFNKTMLDLVLLRGPCCWLENTGHEHDFTLMRWFLLT